MDRPCGGWYTRRLATAGAGRMEPRDRPVCGARLFGRGGGRRGDRRTRYGWRLSFMTSGPPNNSAKVTLKRLMFAL